MVSPLFTHVRTDMYGENRKMGMIRKYIEEGGGNFLKVKNTEVDATVTIQTVRRDDDTFEKSYIVIKGLYDPTGEECNVRLGVQNVERVAEGLGDDESAWPGQKLECIGTATYPGLGPKGLLWRGVKPGQVEEPPKADTTGDIINKILAANPDMTMNAVTKLIEEEKAKAAGLLTDEAAVHLVASNLGVK